MIRNREFAALTVDISGNGLLLRRRNVRLCWRMVRRWSVERTGFYNISGAAVDVLGGLYFVDAHWQKIYR